METEITIHTFILMKYLVTILLYLGAYWGIKRLVRMANAS